MIIGIVVRIDGGRKGRVYANVIMIVDNIIAVRIDGGRKGRVYVDDNIDIIIDVIDIIIDL